MIGDSTCLGLELLGRCNYDPSAPSQSYFTIGQLVSVIALLLAFSQLTKPIIKFRISARQTSHGTAIAISALAIGFVFLAAILPFLPGKALPLVGYPVFWEVLAGVLFVGVAGSLITVISRSPTFDRGKAQAYLKACMTVIAKANDEDLRELAEEIVPAIKPVFDECSLYDYDAAREAKKQGQESSVEESTRIAFTILDLWSDSAFCRNIVCKAPATALKIFDQLIEHASYKSPGYALSQQLIHQAFANRDSLLMREKDYSGLGFFKMFRNTAFGNWRFLESNHRPLQAWRSYEEPVQPWQAEKYSECLAASVHAYLDAEDYWQFPSSLYVGLENLAHLAIQPISELRHISEEESWSSNALRVLREIESGFEDIVSLVEKRQEHLPQYELQDSQYDLFKDVSIYGVVAHGIYEYFEQLAMAKRHDWPIRQCAIGIWLRVFGVSSSTQSTTAEEIGKRLSIHLNKKINENFDTEQRWYPAITRLLISLNGLHEPEKEAKADEGLGVKFHREFIARLKCDYPKLAKADPTFAEDLLPEETTYDSGNNEIRRKRHRQKIDVLKLAPVPGERDGGVA